MIEMAGDLWDAHALGQWIIITTNGTVNRKGDAIMGRGVALDAARRFPELPRALGTLLRQEGSHVFRFDRLHLLTFPVKAHWKEPASLELIAQSAQELVEATEDLGLVYLVRPGCGSGRLEWSAVQPVLSPILSAEKFIVLSQEAP